MAEKQRGHVGLSPRDLYVKSNPGLLKGVDFTNPRDWYNTHAHKHVFETIVKKSERPLSPSHDGVAVVTLPVLIGNEARRTTSQDKHATMNKIPSKSAKSDSFAVLNGNHVFGNSHISSDDSDDEVFKQSGGPFNKLPSVQNKGNPMNRHTMGGHESLSLPRISASDTKYTTNTLATRDDDNNNCNIRTRPKRSIFSDESDKDTSGVSKHKRVQMDCWFKNISDQTQTLVQKQVTHERIQRKLAQAFQNKEVTSRYPVTRRLPPTWAVSEKYHELILPKSDIEKGEVERMYKNYPLHQKSSLKLKSIPKANDRQRVHFHTGRQDGEPSGGVDAKASLGKVKINAPELRVPANQVYAAPDELLISAQPVTPVVKHDITMPNNMQHLNTESDASKESNLSKRGHNAVSASPNRRYVYKAPDDGFVSSGHQNESNRASIINMTIAKKNNCDPGHNIPNSSGAHSSNTENATSHVDVEENVACETSPPGGTTSALSGRVSKKSHQSESKQSACSARSTILKYNKLEVFAEKRKHDMTDVSPVSNAERNDENQKGISSLYTKCSPIYRLDTKTCSQAT